VNELVNTNNKWSHCPAKSQAVKKVVKRELSLSPWSGESATLGVVCVYTSGL